MLYLAVVALTMLVLPLLSIGWAYAASSTDLLRLTGEYFVFWGVGVRLTLAGLRQYWRPQFTVRDIMGVEAPQAYLFVRELGGANVALGTVGLVSLGVPSFVTPAALAAAIVYAVAAGEHLKTAHRGRNENVALWSDVFIAVVLAVFLLGEAARGLTWP